MEILAYTMVMMAMLIPYSMPSGPYRAADGDKKKFECIYRILEIPTPVARSAFGAAPRQSNVTIPGRYRSVTQW